jgi:hypothetical protein
MKSNLIVAASSALFLLSAIASADTSTNPTPYEAHPRATANPGCGDHTIRHYHPLGTHSDVGSGAASGSAKPARVAAASNKR